MDSTHKAWKLRNSTDLWRPYSQASNNGKSPPGRGRLSASDSDCKFPATVRDNEKKSPAKWDSSTSSGAFTHDTSSMSVGSKSSSPILRCRTVSPDLSRSFIADTLNTSESAHQAQIKVNVTVNPETAAVAQHAVSVSAGPTPAAVADLKPLNLTSLEAYSAIERPGSRTRKQQLPRRNKASNPNPPAAQKEVVSRPASVSPQMWQEKIHVSKIKTDRSVVACKRWQSSQGVVAFGTRTPKKKDHDAKNKSFPQSLDVFFVPGVPLPTFTRLQRSIVGKRSSSYPVEQMLLPLGENLEGLQNELVLCSSGAFSKENSCTRDACPLVCDETTGSDRDALSVASLRSPEQCVLMRINMAFEPGMKPSAPCSSSYLEEIKTDDRSLSPGPREPDKTMMSNQVSEAAAQSERSEPNLVLMEQDDGEWDDSCIHEATRSTSQSHIEDEGMANSLKCEANGEPFFSWVVSDDDLEDTGDPRSPRRRRWPKVAPTSSDRNHVERLSTTSAWSNSDGLPGESLPNLEFNYEESFPFENSDQCPQADKVQAEEYFADIIKVDGSTQDDDLQGKNDLCSVRATVQVVETGRGELPLDGTSPANTNLKSRGLHIRSDRPFEKRAGRSPGKWSEEVSLASDTSVGGFSSKTKRSLERATLYKIERKRRDDSSQSSATGDIKIKGAGNKDKVLMRAEAGFPLGILKEREMKRKEEAGISPPKLLSTKKMSISGPPAKFREIRIDHNLRALNLPGGESTSQSEAREVVDSTCNGGRNLLEAQAVQRTDSKYGVQVSGLPDPETDLPHLPDPPTLGNPSGQSCRNTNISERLGEEQEASNCSSEISVSTQPRDGLGVIPRMEGKSTAEVIPRLWSNPLHDETESTDRASLSSEKFSSILSYLGHVEESNLQENYKLLQRRDLAQEGDEAGLSSANSLFEGVRKKMQEFKATIATKESQNAELLRDIERLKADRDQALSLERDRFGKELEVRAAEYKAAIQHHLALNEKMVKDKEALSEKCCNLAGILNSVELKFEDKMTALKEKFAQDLKKQKEIWLAGEKPRREAWKEKKIKEIKELTIKGLEPHIEGLNEKHKLEIKRLETRYADETQKKLELQSIDHRQEICDLRNRFLKERDEILEKERMSALTRINHVAEKYEQQAMELRRKVSSDMAAELEKVEEARRKDKQIAHEMLSKALQESNDREAASKRSLEKSIEDAVADKNAELLTMQAELQRFKNDWQKDFDEKLRQKLQIQVDEMKSRCTKERDEQIEMIIEKMENEKDEAIAQNQQELLVKVETLMEEKLESMKKLKEVESKCANLCKVALEAKQKAEMDSANKDMQVESLRRELLCQADLIEHLKSQIQQEKANLKEQERRFELRLSKEHELLQAAELDADRLNAETQQLRIKKAKELEEVEIHVRQAIDHKDQVIAGLREQLLASREQIRHTELLLQQEHNAFAADPD
ncbi:5-azacytidine-induced protein 1 [Marchantia polymorpha subsp. ruderalis]|uniref:Centrosomal protein of 131 kDa n=2 Tax=Marchantia polymorpha TaxID=3197 RepID=A0A2R6W145_MARPO|nr:hypothetical protein MARPO_0192s0003 [Marchantia polymorpha]BBN20373.1 hypothetical protein Mp_8g18580 [Marchantia polymorpha subsp. ruderalis]|eukprot:PTQ27565.1 hypothetical protein MARPO_0192s0003 [Marchantia polymorpha]